MTTASAPTPGARVWGFRSRRSGFHREIPLRLYWEVNCDPISDDYTPAEIDAEALWCEWLRRYPVDKHSKFGPHMFEIYWFVEGPGVFEAAPFADHQLATDDFLGAYTWPVDPSTGDRLQFSRLPVVDKVWREDNVPDGAVFKGGFIQEATGWKPSPFQSHVNVYQLGRIAGLYVPPADLR